ncbi:MAG: NlpC/P60 family protein [Bacteroidota bacterium]
MKIRVTLILFLLPLLLCAQTKKQKRKKAKAEKQAFEQYYSKYSLKPDSAITPYLYYQVYQWIGTNYKYSGDTKKGIDCSGFVCEMYQNVYCTSLSGGSCDIWTKVVPIEKSDLKEGDILFFKIKKGKISHVGIYLGNNKFAHASVHSGVIISDLDEAYYKKSFYKGGRLP